MDINRKTAYLVLMAVETKKQYSNIALNHNIKREKPTSEAFVRELAYGVLENKKLLDYVISKLITGKLKNVRTPDLTILRMGIYQIAKMSSVPEYAAVDESVQLAKKYARGRDKFINGVLRSYIRDRYNITLPDREKELVKYLSVKYSYEEWIIKLWMEEFDAEFTESLLAAGNQTPPLTIRTNTGKISRDELIAELRQHGFEAEKCNLAENGIKVIGEGLLETEAYKQGKFSVQDEASQVAVQLLDPRPGELVIDVCAAPGGKTLASAERMDGHGTVVAQDIYAGKTDIIEREAKRLGLVNIKTKTWDATRLRQELCGKADKVIVDAPCSGLGVVRRKTEIKYKKNNEQMASLPVKQLAILETAANYLVDGGLLMYSTCTVNHYENRRVAEDFVRRNPEFKIEDRIQLLPNVNGTDGFYICLMRKEAKKK